MSDSLFDAFNVLGTRWWQRAIVLAMILVAGYFLAVGQREVWSNLPGIGR